MDAPLSSPSVRQPQNSYFSSQSSQQSNGPTSASQAQTQQQNAPPPPAPQRQSSQDATSPFLRDFNLVAEAAKRAQMAVLMRDMEAIGI